MLSIIIIYDYLIDKLYLFEDRITMCFLFKIDVAVWFGLLFIV